MPHALPLASSATMETHDLSTMGGIATMPIAALPETDFSPAIHDIPALSAVFSTGFGGTSFFALSNYDSYTPSDV